MPPAENPAPCRGTIVRADSAHCLLIDNRAPFPSAQPPRRILDLRRRPPVIHVRVPAAPPLPALSPVMFQPAHRCKQKPLVPDGSDGASPDAFSDGRAAQAGPDLNTGAGSRSQVSSNSKSNPRMSPVKTRPQSMHQFSETHPGPGCASIGGLGQGDGLQISSPRGRPKRQRTCRGPPPGRAYGRQSG